MKFNKITALYLCALTVSIFLRFLQLFFTVEPSTGFFIPESNGMGTTLLILILLCSLFVALFSRLTYKQPDNLPVGNLALSVSSTLLAASIILETLFSHISLPIISWQNLLLKFFSIGTALYLLSFAISPLFGFKIKPIFATLPAIYSIIRMICDFTLVSKLAIISDNIILISVYLVSMFFFLNYAKFYNNMQDERGYKKILSYGLTLSVLSFTNSVPNIIFGILFEGFNHISLFTNITVLFIGLFATIFTFSFK